MADLGRLHVSRVGDRGIDLRGSRADCVRGPAHASPARAGRRRALWWLRPHAVRDGPLRVSLLVGRLLGVGVRRRDGKTRRALGHLVLRSNLLLWRRMLLWRSEAGLVASGHDAAEEAIAGGDRRGLLRWAWMLRGAWHAWLRATLAGSFELMPEHAIFFLIPGGGVTRLVRATDHRWGARDILLLQGHVCLLHRVHLFSHELHLVDLR